MISFFSWEILYPLGAALLGLVLAWGMWSYNTRNRRNDPVSDAATRAIYDHPDTYQDEIKPALDRQLRD